MKPVNAFGDRVRFLPSIPATDAHPIHSIGYSNALVEMAQQSRAFVRKYAVEHLRLVAHIKRLNLGQELGYDSLDAMLDVVALEEEWPIRGPPAPVARHVAEAAGAPGQTATDAAPPTRVREPQGSGLTTPVPSAVLSVHSTAPVDKGPAVSAPPRNPTCGSKSVCGRGVRGCG